jgi:hypothetical protein
VVLTASANSGMGLGYTYWRGGEALRGFAKTDWEMGFAERVEEQGVGERRRRIREGERRKRVLDLAGVVTGVEIRLEV